MAVFNLSQAPGQLSLLHLDDLRATIYLLLPELCISKLEKLPQLTFMETAKRQVPGC